ncbi:LTA synthase family protein [Neobacillus cucumis]|uniref:LTA synthase family protein n=1 Tax=Neobacillus cucumis TaxID=1740721 RepID=UPI002852F6C1|nr:LTA synthase family protein [Neobacillus cucumis]MDR4949471.1 LTA synthase family protein [Neobacillus cucumis]
MKKRNKLFKSFLTIFILILSTVIFSFATYIKKNFANQSLEEMIFYLVSNTKGTPSDVIISAIQSSFLPFLLILFIVFIPVLGISRRRDVMEVKMKHKKFTFRLFPLKLIYKFRLLYAFLIFILSLITCYHFVGAKHYVKGVTDTSTFIDTHYVDGSKVSLTFPKQKRNLIIVYLESMENSMIDKDNGGGWNYNVIPELTTIAKTNLNFSNSDKIGGANRIFGTTWTVGGLVGTTSGLPLKIPVNGNQYTSSNFLAGAYTLGDVLKKEGYNQEVIFGSDANFGGRKSYYKRHGDYLISDFNTAVQEGKMQASQKVWWGYDDTHLFDWAKEEISSLANAKKPFSMTLLTANTHFPDGYLESKAEKKYPTQYENVFAYSSKQVDGFVKWLQQQDFYPNTTIVLLGDHLSMQPGGYFEKYMIKGYSRTTYNAFINPAIEPVQSKNRIFTALDMYPTILASMGVTIQGDRLGLGTNLFSNRRTIEEESGLGFLNSELAKDSKFYNEQILQDDYFKLMKRAQNQ